MDGWAGAPAGLGRRIASLTRAALAADAGATALPSVPSGVGMLELFRTKTDPITEGYIERLLKALQAAGVQITREQIRLVEWP